MQIQHKKNTAFYLVFPMVDDTSPESFKTGVSPADTAYYKDGAGAWTALPIADTASEIGSTGLYEIDLAAGELNHDYVLIKFSVADAADTAFLFTMSTKVVDDLNDIAQSDILDDATPFSGGDIASILTDTAEIGAAGAGLTAVPWNASWDAEVQSECTDALNAYDPPTKTEMDSVHATTDALISGLNDPTAAAITDAVWDEILTGASHNIATSAGRRLRQLGDALAATVNDGSPTTTAFDTTLTNATDDFYNDQLIRFTTGNLTGQVRVISDYDGTDKTITVDPALTEAPGNGDAFDVLPTHVHPPAEIAGAVWDETSSGHTGAGKAGQQLWTDVDAILTDTAEIGAAGAGLSAVPWNAAWDAEVQSECTDALNAYDPPTKTEMDTVHSTTDALISGLNDLSAAQVNAQVVDVLKTDVITLPAQGAPTVTPTIEEALAYLYKGWRNKLIVDSSTAELYDDAGTTVDQKWAVSDDGTDFTKGEVATGP